MSAQPRAQVSFYVHCLNSMTRVIGARLIPPHAVPLGERRAIARHDIIRIDRQIGAQLVERPYRLLERNTNHTLDRLRELPIRDGIAGNIDDLINDARFGKQYFRGELSDIFWRRNGDLRIPATQPVDGSAFKVYDPKRRLKQEAGEHAG